MYAYGNNKQNLAENFLHRRFYDKFIMPINSNEPSRNITDEYIDIFVNKPFYGRIDDKSNSTFSAAKILDASKGKNYVGLDEKRYLKKFLTSDLYAINFVVDAFEDMIAEYNRSCQMISGLNRTGPLSNIKAETAWISPIQRYNEFLKGIYNIYKNKLLEQRNESDFNNIRNFDDFLQSFLPFLTRNAESFSIVFSSFLISKHISPACSGLMIEIAIDDHSDDFVKTSGYTTDINYQFFRNMARKYGFYIDRNTPWRLFANISSSNMLPYMQKYKLNNPSDVFSKQYISCYEYDLIFFKNALYYIYNLFLADNPVYKEVSLIDCEEISVTKYRNSISLQDYYDKYPDEKFLQLYVNLRAKSVRLEIDDPAVKHILKQSMIIYKTKKLKHCLSFINNKLNIYRKKLMNKDYLTQKNVSDIIF